MNGSTYTPLYCVSTWTRDKAVLQCTGHNPANVQVYLLQTHTFFGSALTEGFNTATTSPRETFQCSLWASPNRNNVTTLESDVRSDNFHTEYLSPCKQQQTGGASQRLHITNTVHYTVTIYPWHTHTHTHTSVPHRK